MKKLIALIATLSILIAMTGCGANEAPPPDNKYVAMAKEYGYWHGLGGISWGMSIDETLEVFNITKEDVIPVMRGLSGDGIEVEEIGIVATMFNIPAHIRFTYYKSKHPETKMLAEKEWLAEIMVSFDETQTSKTIIPLIQEDLTSLKLDYKEQGTEWSSSYTWSNKESLDTINVSNNADEAITLYKSFLKGWSEEYIENFNLSKRSLDEIALIFNNELDNVIYFTLKGTAAAILAKSH